MNEKNEFKPYIPADKVTPEFTITSIVMGILLAVVFGAANAYLGLRVGMICIHSSRRNFHGCHPRYHAQKFHLGK